MQLAKKIITVFILSGNLVPIMELNRMKIAKTNVIPTQVPSGRKNQPNFGMSDDERTRKEEERRLHQQKNDLERLGNDKTNPLSAPMKVLAVATGAVITAGAMKVTLNTSLDMISKALKSEVFIKTRTTATKAFKNVKESVSEGLKSLKETIIEKYDGSKLSNFVSKQKGKLAKTGLGKWTAKNVSPKVSNLKEAIKILKADIKQVSKEKMPTHEKIKKIFVDATAILSGGGVAIKESGAINKSSHYDDDGEDF